ncbi:hypothetical protein CcI156_12750 [Frankia sp. CcI156]|uniref:Uncharacterized protein n=2 Tax=Frankia casuarinae (strain DSM 45818 / CECT 9043 / HFP020203 / CcI3) TaxID=106370 RepID=Q2JBE5_FRACC|nr:MULTISPECIES: DUF2786 domain-containing protein [Frankia]ABD11397.1 conserved hypothetical protein [Frankia casuarinae]ETA01516.1 hypothetical protein CcI6DRAFT_02991 [Frankia sp. CcI6]EYT91887.1 hypothetical protein ThrDRAFT_02406 [Frankia casuarinae]KDA42686.1 hypothetical protein BMG523Draft_02526 [Frankia sp. BMG5.23]KEZ35521.1 Protein of unknown function (DUF2786) [Frankia sp. CeD]
MGSRNRERRKAKQKARANRVRAQAPESGAGAFYQEERGQREMFRRIADQLVAAALNAQLARDEAALAEYVELLVAAPGGPAGRRVVNRSLAGWFDRTVEAAWQRGWQPADVHRIVNRQAGQRQARLAVDAIAGQMRQYAAATVDERWKNQLYDLNAVLWWEDDGTWLDAWGDREGRDRAEALADTLGLLTLLHTLPAIESLCPPPGTTRRDPPGRPAGRGHGQADPGHRAGAGRSADPRILDKVRALLAKAESTGFADEAEALTAKAQQLMARHSIDEALLAAREGTRDEPAGRRVGVDSPYEAAKASLLDVVAGANRCRSVWTKNLGFATVIGFQPDLDAVELLYTSLLVQATAAMMQAGSRHGRSRTRSFRQSFLASFAVRIGQRLTAATEQASEQAAVEAGESRLLPVLAARGDAVKEAAETMFPQVVARAVNATDGEGWASGRAAADLASLHTYGEVTTARSR